MVEEIHKDDIGTKIIVTMKDGTTAVDISTATTKQIIFEKSDGTVVAKDAAFDSDGTDGKIFYIIITDDLNLTGSWKMQGRVTMPTGTWRSNVDLFTVYGNLEE